MKTAWLCCIVCALARDETVAFDIIDLKLFFSGSGAVANCGPISGSGFGTGMLSKGTSDAHVALPFHGLKEDYL